MEAALSRINGNGHRKMGVNQYMEKGSHFFDSGIEKQMSDGKGIKSSKLSRGTAESQ